MNKQEEEEGDAVGYGRVKGPSAIGDGGQVPCHSHLTLMEHAFESESSQLEGSYTGDLLFSCQVVSDPL